MSAAGRPASPRADWPLPEPETAAGAALTELILTTFRLNGRLLEAANELAAEGGITAAWWQVLGGVLDEPRTVSAIARLMGMTRQGVQRNADLLVENGLAEFHDNPAHRRARLLAPTEAGLWAVRRISIAQHPWAARIGAEVGEAELRRATATMRSLIECLEDAGEQAPDTAQGGRKPTERAREQPL